MTRPKKTRDIIQGASDLTLKIESRRANEALAGAGFDLSNTEVRLPGPSHDEVKATIRDASLPPEVRLSLLALSYADKPLTITEVREAAGLRDRDVILALRMARSLGRIVLAGDRYSLKRGA